MRTYTIAGKKKIGSIADNYCTTCRNGKGVFTESIYKTDISGDNHKEIICNICKSKYKQTLIQPKLKVDFFPGRRITTDDYKRFEKTNPEYLTEENSGFFQLRIAIDYEREVKKMDIVDLKEEYDKTKKCKLHRWVVSRPFRTAEGRYTIKSCAICSLAEINYNGTNYRDDLWKIVNFIAHQGIEFGKKAEKVEEDLFGTTDLFNLETAKDIQKSQETLNLFDDVEDVGKDLFTIEVEQELF